MCGKSNKILSYGMHGEKPEYQYVFIGANADTNSNIIRQLIRDYANSHCNAVYYENLHTDAYHYLVKNAVCLIGNSSSGIIEAPSLGACTINIGSRQDGRVRGNSIVDVECKTEAIQNAMDQILASRKKLTITNPYYQENSATKYYETTKMLLADRLPELLNAPKVFYDVQFLNEGNGHERK